MEARAQIVEMKKGKFWFVALILLMAACGLNEQAEQPSSIATATSEQATPVEPISISVTLEQAHAVSAVIPITGGSLTTTGADGTTFTLEIPGDALVYETEITMTPAEFSGLPAGFEPGPGVQLEPEGLSLFNFATLTITPATEIPIDRQVLFGSEANGQNLSLALPEIDSPEIEILLLHFSNYLVARGSLNELALTIQGSAVVEGLSNRVAELTQRERQFQKLEGRRPLAPEYWAELTRLFKEYYDSFVKGYLDRAGESCKKGSQALAIYAHYTHLMRKAMLEDQIVQIDGLALLQKVGGLCLKEEYQLCVNDHIVHRMIPVLFGIERKMLLVYEAFGLGEESAADSALVQEARKLTEQCLRFELQFESTSISPACGGDSGGAGKVEVAVSANIPIRFADFSLHGESPLVLESYEVIPCPLLDIPTTSNFEEGSTRASLRWKVVPEYFDPDEELGMVIDLHLVFSAGSAYPSTDWAIQGWDFVFSNLHSDQLCGPLGTGDLRVQAICGESTGVFALLDWQIVGQKLFAVLDWQKKDGIYSESGSLLLYHRPGE